MAGIGFQLRKLYEKEGVIPKLKAHIYSTFVTVGPIILSIIVITFLQTLLRRVGVDRGRMIELQLTIMYSFVFSVIVASGYCMLLSRYLSDRFYNHEIEDILPSLYGAISIILLIAGPLGAYFYYNSSLPIDHRFFGYALFIELIIEMVLAVYISALDEYKRVSFSFFFGTLAGIVSYYVLVVIIEYDYIVSVLIAFSITIGLVDALLLIEIRKHFTQKSTKYFNFIKYYSKFYPIFFINLFYTVGLYAHDFAFWTHDVLRHHVAETFIYAPYYDFPAFYAFLSAIPTLIIFVVKVETDFFEQYTNYFTMINKGACYEDIEVAKKKMVLTIYQNIVYIMQMQLFFSLVGIIVGMLFLPLAGFTSEMVTIYSLSVIGFYFTILMFVVMTMILYFDDKKSGLIISGHFVVGSFVYSYITTLLGPAFYGLGFICAGAISLVIAFYRLDKYLKEIDYRIFCMAISFEKEEKNTILNKTINRFNQIGIIKRELTYDKETNEALRAEMGEGSEEKGA